MAADDSPADAGCPFCAIARGDAPAHRVYQDAVVTAFMDKNPINPGHLLIIPARHVADFYDLDDETLAHLMRVARRLAVAVKRAFAARKVGMVIAGFDVPHAHLNLIPMHDYHDITSRQMLEGTLVKPAAGELAAAAEAIKAALG